MLLNDVNFGTCNHNNSGIIRARERVLVENAVSFCVWMMMWPRWRCVVWFYQVSVMKF